MTHNLEQVSSSSLSALVVRGKANGGTRDAAPVYARFTKLGGFNGSYGLRIKVRRISDDTGLGPVDISGEDLYALREFLAELPEEAFVRPADPIEKPPRWTDCDVVEEVGRSGARYIWVRDYTGVWRNQADRATGRDSGISDAVDGKYAGDITVLRQASGQDLKS